MNKLVDKVREKVYSGYMPIERHNELLNDKIKGKLDAISKAAHYETKYNNLIKQTESRVLVTKVITTIAALQAIALVVLLGLFLG